MNSIATSTTAAALFLLSGKAVVSDDRTSSATAWIAKPVRSNALRPNLSTVKVLTRTMTSCNAAWMPLMDKA